MRAVTSMRQRTKNRLTDLEVRKAKDGWLNDGVGLHLRTKGQSKKWVFRYTLAGKAVEIGCGAADRVSLKLAREKRDQYLDMLARGLDPRVEKVRLAAELREKLRKQAVERRIIGRKRLTHTEASGPFHLYRHFGFDAELLYVGESRSVIERWRQHKYAKAEWTDLVAVITVDHYPTRREAKDAEAEAILTEKPRFNRTVLINRLDHPQQPEIPEQLRVLRRSRRKVWPKAGAAE
jgi:hypothetical protein